MGTILILALVTVALALSVPSSNVSTTQYDYIICGGGTAGMAVAARLTENPAVSVLVIEAGHVTAQDYWRYNTTDQVYANGSPTQLYSGKGVGGSSLVNGMVYLRADRAQLDAWQMFGNDNWTWSDLFPYYTKSEHFDAPTSREVASGSKYDPAFHGFAGPLHVGFFSNQSVSDLYNLTRQAYQDISEVPIIDDPNGGAMRGLTQHPWTIKNGTIRESSRAAYYDPIKSTRTNLHLLTETVVTRILWSATHDSSDAVASGVEILNSNGTLGTYSVGREVILSAGSYRTPLILEYSGVGNPKILEPLGIQTVVNLPGVGEHLSDQTSSNITYLPLEQYKGTSNYVAYLNVTDLFLENTTAFADSVQASLSDWAAKIPAVLNGATSHADMLAILQRQYDLIFQDEVTVMEMMEGGNLETGTVGTKWWGTVAFGRGNVHINDSSYQRSSVPLINPNYFMFDFEYRLQIAMGRFLRRLFTSAPLAHAAGRETFPSLETVPEDADDEGWRDWMFSTYSTIWHPLGTSSMMPREIGGVVDARLKVYGTSNVRVIDASIFPGQVSGHPSSSVYMAAEKGADLIKEDGNAF